MKKEVSMLDHLVLGDTGLSLSVNGADTRFDYFWLRDNARDPVSFDSRSHQRELFTAALDPAIRPTSAQLTRDASALVLEWPDLDVQSEYGAAFLAEFAVPGDGMRLPAAQPWDRATLDHESVRVPFDALTGDDGVRPLMERLVSHGFAVVTGTPRNLDAVEKLSNDIGYVRQTIFGGLFEFEANEDMADSAYTPKELRPHTDGTYSLDAPGVQLLLCIDYKAQGGESIMVDGARIAAALKAEAPTIYDDLTRIGVTGIYKG
jgi:trimethyllysine dioxygenase